MMRIIESRQLPNTQPKSGNQKSPTLVHQTLFSLARHGDVGRLQALSAFFDSKLDLLAFLQVAVSITLNGREMDENVRSAFAGDKTVALVAIEPLDRTN